MRECTIGRNYASCVGESEESEVCGEEQCPAWTEWTDWTECSQSCGGGQRSKVCIAARYARDNPVCAGAGVCAGQGRSGTV